MRVCRECGCGDFTACVYRDEGTMFTCFWVTEDLCSFCALDYSTPPDLRERVQVPGVDNVIIAGAVL
jgi:hypothetical protein